MNNQNNQNKKPETCPACKHYDTCKFYHRLAYPETVYFDSTIELVLHDITRDHNVRNAAFEAIVSIVYAACRFKDKE